MVLKVLCNSHNDFDSVMTNFAINIYKFDITSMTDEQKVQYFFISNQALHNYFQIF